MNEKIRYNLGEKNGYYKHGLSNHFLHSTWRSIMTRCYNKNSRAYKWYGAKGVKVCQRWHEFINFYNDVINTHTDGCSIDRFPNKQGDYEPSNFRWATSNQQGRNKNDTKLHLYNGEMRCIPEISELTGVGKDILYGRLRSGETIDEALKSRKYNKATSVLRFNGIELSLKDWSEMKNINISTLRYRLKHKWPIEKVFSKSEF